MKKLFIMLCIGFFGSMQITAQSIDELYEAGKYRELLPFADSTAHLNADETFKVAYALYRDDQDERAVALFDKSIEKDSTYFLAHLYKGRSFIYRKMYAEAAQSFLAAGKLQPEDQRCISGIGDAYFFQDQFDSAEVYYQKAVNLEYVLGDPYYRLPLTYLYSDQPEKALAEFRKGFAKIERNDRYASLIQQAIGDLEMDYTKNYSLAAEAYTLAFELDNEEFSCVSRLIMANNKMDQTDNDSLFSILVEAYNKEQLGDFEQKYGRVRIDEFMVEDRWVYVFRCFKIPEEFAESIYMAYVLDDKGEEAERLILTERTIITTDDGESMHFLCEQGLNNRFHGNFGYTWQGDVIPYSSFKEQLLNAISDKNGYVAASYTGGGEEDGKKKKKKKKRKKKNKKKKKSAEE